VAKHYVTLNTEKLDELSIEGFCDEVINGKSYTKIADEQGVSKAALLRWLSQDADRAARARDARTLSSHTFDDMAEDVLRDASVDPARARELASHYRWRASKIAPREYGDKLQIDQTTHVMNLSDDEVLRRSAAIEAKLREGAEPAPE
jgi:hypothetical protein